MKEATKLNIIYFFKTIGITLQVSFAVGGIVFVITLATMLAAAFFFPELLKFNLVSALIAFAAAFIVMIIISFIVCINAGKSASDETRLLKKMGICPEFIEEFKKVANLNDLITKFHIGDYYLAIQDYENAEKWLFDVDIDVMDNYLAALCLIDRANVYVVTGRLEQADAIFSEYSQLFEKFIAKDELNAMLYQLSLASVHTYCGRYDEALKILSRAEEEYVSEKFNFGFFVKKELVFTYSRMEETSLMYQKYHEGIEAIEKITSFPYDWSRQFYILTLDNARIGID